MNKQVNQAIDNLVISLRSEGTLKTPKTYTISELHSRIKVAFTNPLTNDCLVDEKVFNEIVSQITDKFRDFICESCNKGLGMFKDNISLLEEAINYLKEHDETER